VNNDDNDEEGSSTSDEESFSDGDDNVRLLRAPLRPPLPSPSSSLDGRRQQRRPLALEDQLEILHHNFAPTNRPAPLPVTMTTTMNVSDGAGVVDRCRCLGGVNDDGNATMAATTTTPWRTEKQQRS